MNQIDKYAECEKSRHDWVANSGRGGEPDFKTNRMLSGAPVMHVMCEKCGCRIWFTEPQWRAL